ELRGPASSTCTADRRKGGGMCPRPLISTEYLVGVVRRLAAGLGRTVLELWARDRRVHEEDNPGELRDRPDAAGGDAVHVGRQAGAAGVEEVLPRLRGAVPDVNGIPGA